MKSKKENFNGGNSNQKTVYAFVIAIIVLVIADLILFLTGFSLQSVFTITGMSVFIIIGIWCIFDYPKSLRKKKSNCTQTVSSVIVDCIVNSSDDGKAYYAIYEYTFNNTVYRANTREDYGKKPKNGIDAKIVINPNNPTEIYEIERETARINSMRTVGVVVLVISIFALFDVFESLR